MAPLTIRVLDGADRGRVFDDLTTPVTIGREEGNAIQLNDERVSRFHLKIQEDHGRIVLTDLESTNGTRVNGEDVQLHILRFGDLIQLGRSVLLFGSREQIAGRLSELHKIGTGAGVASRSGKFDLANVSSLDFELNWENHEELQELLFALQPPELPDRLSAGQAAQLVDVFEFLHVRIRQLLETVKPEKKGARVTLDAALWQILLDLQSRLAEYLRAIGEPGAANDE